MAIIAVAQRATGYQVQAPVTHLPRDITLLYLMRLPLNQIAVLQRVSKYFWEILRTDDDNLWKRLFQRDFPRITIPSAIVYKVHYQNCFLTEQNWKKGRYIYQRFATKSHWLPMLSLKGNRFLCMGTQSTPQIRDINDPFHVIELKEFPHNHFDEIQFSEDENLAIIYSSQDYSPNRYLHIYDKSNGERLGEFQGRFFTYAFDGTQLFFKESTSRSINVWNRNTRQVKTLISNIADFQDKFMLDGNLLFLIYGAIMQCWNTQDGTLVREIGSWKDVAILKFYIDGEYLFCFYPNKIKLLNKTDGSLIYEVTTTFHIEKFSICMGENVIAIHHHNSISCWNKKDGSLLFEIQVTRGKLSLLSDRCFFIPWQPNIPHIVCCGNIEIRDKDNGTLIHNCLAGGEQIEVIYADNYRLISLSDHKLKFWEIKTGNLLYMLNQVSQCQVLNNRMIIFYRDRTFDICDFSPNPEVPFPNIGQLPIPNGP